MNDFQNVARHSGYSGGLRQEDCLRPGRVARLPAKNQKETKHKAKLRGGCGDEHL
jgi:hypothetical protein